MSTTPSSSYLSPGIMRGKKCLLIQKLKWDYHFLGRHQSFTEQNTVAGSFPKINSLFASTIKGPQTIVHALRFGNRWLHLMHSCLSAWHSVYKSSIYTYGGNLQGHQLLVWKAVFSLHTVHYRKSCAARRNEFSSSSLIRYRQHDQTLWI